ILSGDAVSFVFPSGLVLDGGDLPWVWCVTLKSGMTDYVFGSAREADRYARGINNLLDSIVSVDPDCLNGLVVRPEGVLARALPAWCRECDDGPRHESWTGPASQ